MNISNKINSWILFFKSVIKELKYLKIPTKAETFVYLIIVLLMAVVCSILFYMMDKAAYWVINKILFIFA